MKKEWIWETSNGIRVVVQGDDDTERIIPMIEASAKKAGVQLTRIDQEDEE